MKKQNLKSLVVQPSRVRGGGFTMAEILLSLTIIGVVAAITLPSLTGNINERTWNTQRKALYARMSQAISLMPALNGYGTLIEGTDSTSAQDTVAETFITSGLAKVLKINNICSDNLEDCGIVNSFTNMANVKIPTPTTLHDLNAFFSQATYGGASFSTLNTNAAAFESQNGESIIAYYNPSCTTEYISNETVSSTGNTFGFPQKTMCVNFIYDLNGNKGPNTVGKDIGIMTVFNATDSVVVAPVPSSTNYATYEGNNTIAWENAAKACSQEDSESRLPNIEELSSMLINQNIINLNNAPGDLVWSSTVFSAAPRQAWQVYVTRGVRDTENKSLTRGVRCVKR